MSSFLGSIAHGIEHLGQQVGHVAGQAAPFIAPVLAATGVGLPLAAVIAGGAGAAGSLSHGGSVTDALMQGLKTGATGYATGGATSGLLNSVKAAIAKGGISSLPGVLLDNAKAEAGRVAGRVAAGQSPIALPAGAGADGAGAAGGGASMPALLKLLGLGAAGAAGVSGFNDAKHATDQQNQALDRNVAIAQAQADQGNAILKGAAPIRTAAESAMTQRLAQGAPAPTSAAQFANPSNPFRKKYGTPAVPSPAGI
jgi:hypothetical protein